MVTITDCDRVLVTSDDCLTRVALLSKNRIDHLFYESARNVSNVGNIYKGRITRVLKGLGAAFVDIGETKNGFLPFEEAEEMYVNEEADEGGGPVPLPPPAYQVGEQLLLQVTKPATGTKGPKLTTHLSIPGRLLVLLPLTPRRGVSRRIEDMKERRRLLTIMNNALPDTMGCIMRTACEKQPEERILSEIKHLRQIWSRIHREAQKVQAPRLLWKEAELPEQVVRDMVGDEAREIWVDSEHHYRSLRQYARTFVPEIFPRIKLYRERMPLFVKYDVERQFEQFLESRVSLTSGGSLIFEESETLVAIDVNSGGAEHKNLNETIFHVNMEAAREIPRQIRIRNLSGLLIIDFIDMRNEGQRKEVFRTLEQYLEEDRARLKIFSISKLGLVEMSREKFGLSLRQLLTTRCERCGGAGVIPSLELCAIRIKNAILEKLSTHPGARITVNLSEDVHRFIHDQRLLNLGFLESRRVTFRPQSTYRSEEFEITEDHSREHFLSSFVERHTGHARKKAAQAEELPEKRLAPAPPGERRLQFPGYPRRSTGHPAGHQTPQPQHTPAASEFPGQSQPEIGGQVPLPSAEQSTTGAIPQPTKKSLPHIGRNRSRRQGRRRRSHRTGAQSTQEQSGRSTPRPESGPQSGPKAS